MNANYSGIPVSFVEQTENKGLGHTVSLASDYISACWVLSNRIRG